MGGDVISINMKGNYNYSQHYYKMKTDVIPINMKGNYNR